ncbi:hypothetical protein BU23DRAFT_553163 [Bimuria novae-zelandiae CBS 107.79]|uniref:MINDY deubiquitinase domain-containing protein n=1 Tax=Bimuria novae-zelandiae CBS 107.79 TaxID=1447943 RepID=A0A6A5VBD8_9PLEO|nr:hypothetical protein BU23DRAFT_553163 [Bimuria novae-zelandiae CBS 107.79]
MVLRKQDDAVPRPLSHATNNPPYPTTPAEEHPPQLHALSTDHQDEVYSPDLNKSPAFQLKPLDEARKQKDDNDSVYSENEWDQSDDDTPDDIPDPLKIGGKKAVPAPATEKKDSLPDVLKAGPRTGMPIKKPLLPLEKISPEPTGTTPSSYASNASGGSQSLQTNNPYLKMQQTGQSNFGAESSQQVWGDAPAQAQQYAVELPSYRTPDTPTNPMANLSIGNNRPTVVQQGFKSPGEPPNDVMVAARSPSASSNQNVNGATGPAPAIDGPSLDAWEKNYTQPQQSNNQHFSQASAPEEHPWGHNETQSAQYESAVAKEEQAHPHENTFAGAVQPPAHPPLPIPFPSEEELPPSLPPRRSLEDQPPPMPQRPREELPPPMPLRPLETGVTPAPSTAPESPNTVMNRQRKETYQIKHIRWHDVNKREIRTSPILTQNINGPCPLLALVNALILSTPAGVETALVETLRTREQVSLGLLLDAVFDELMSGRRGDAAQELPDVSDLYKFLLALHTGLNVNPMFVQDAEATDGTSTGASLTARPGVFENTRDMKLYRTFNLPLMHGWLPDPGSDAYRAFERIAKTYETSQYVQFQEEELDAKLQSGEALTTDEQQMFTDIHAIKEFLNTWPTQLTTYGLKIMRNTLKPGQVAILFRNDHFSTLYKDPRTDNLVTLVTDQGYSSHDEIVWESLVDVNGQGSELFSGDFRPVGGAISPQRSQNQPPTHNMLEAGDEGWTTIQRRGNQQTPLSSMVPPDNAAPLSPGSDLNRVEQEDHDLALALQLQEEEDDRHRRDQEERHRRENQLSEDAITAQSQQRSSNRRTSRTGETPPVIPPRRNNAPIHRPANEPAPPPTYEEAATTPTYHPPAGHPASPNAPVRPQGSAYQANTQNVPLINQIPNGSGRRNSRPNMPHPAHPGRPGRRQSGVVPPGQEERDKCVIM